MSAAAVLGALDGVRIVDLTQMLAGPFCTMLLADQGAEVIKVEPLDGDHTRIIGPYHVDDKLKAFGGYFASVNRNKKSIAIDLKKAQVIAGTMSPTPGPTFSGVSLSGPVIAMMPPIAWLITS